MGGWAEGKKMGNRIEGGVSDWKEKGGGECPKGMSNGVEEGGVCGVGSKNWLGGRKCYLNQQCKNYCS